MTSQEGNTGTKMEEAILFTPTEVKIMQEVNKSGFRTVLWNLALDLDLDYKNAWRCVWSLSRKGCLSILKTTCRCGLRITPNCLNCVNCRTAKTVGVPFSENPGSRSAER
jgi:hypothetical protein